MADNGYWLHWRFFETLDDDLHAFSRYVEFTEANAAVFSVELSRLYLSICSEVDVILKMLCAKIDPQKSPGNISAYQPIIFGRYKHFHEVKVLFPRARLASLPWAEWKPNSSPKWWNDHNDVKHHRNEHFSKANLNNVLDSAAGLFVALVYLSRDQIWRGYLRPTSFRVFALEPGIEDVVVAGGRTDKGSDFDTINERGEPLH